MQRSEILRLKSVENSPDFKSEGIDDDEAPLESLQHTFPVQPGFSMSAKISRHFAAKRKQLQQDVTDVKRALRSSNSNTIRVSSSRRQELDLEAKRTEQREKEEEKIKSSKERRQRSEAKETKRLRMEMEEAQQEREKRQKAADVARKREEKQRLKEEKEYKKREKEMKMIKQVHKFEKFFVPALPQEVQFLGDDKMRFGTNPRQSGISSSNEFEIKNSPSLSEGDCAEQNIRTSDSDDEPEIEIIMANVVKPTNPNAEKFCPLPFQIKKGMMIAPILRRDPLSNLERKSLEAVVKGHAKNHKIERTTYLCDITQELKSKNKGTSDIVLDKGDKRNRIKFLQFKENGDNPAFHGVWFAKQAQIRYFSRGPCRTETEHEMGEDIWDDASSVLSEDTSSSDDVVFMDDTNGSDETHQNELPLEFCYEIANELNIGSKLSENTLGKNTLDNPILQFGDSSLASERLARKAVRAVSKIEKTVLFNGKREWDYWDAQDVPKNINAILNEMFS